MAQTIDELQVLITANTASLQKELKTVKGQLKGVESAVSKSGKGISTGMIAVGSMIGSALTRVLSTAVSAISSSLDGAVSRLDTLNNFPRVMSNLGIGAEDAQRSINILSDKLQGLPTTLDEAATAVQRFTSANSDVGASTEMFLALNNAILAGGASSEIQSSALEQLSQSYAKGKPDMMEWRTAMMAMPAQLKQVAVAMGYASSNDLGEALRNGSISMNDFMATLVRLNKTGANGFASLEEQARNSTGGVATSITNLKTAITKGLTAIMDAIGQTNISGFFNAVGRAIGVVSSYIAAFVKVTISAVNAVRSLFGLSAVGAKKVADNASSASSSMQGVGSAAVGAGKQIDGAAGSAKKLAKQLAGFDEMNVLKEPDSGGGGGGAGGGGVDAGSLELDMGDVWKGLDKTEDKATKIASKIQAAFQRAFTTIASSPAFQSIGELVSHVASNIVETFNAVAPQVQQGWLNLTTYFSQMWTDMTTVANEKIPLLTEQFQIFFDTLHGIVQPAVMLLGSIWSGYTEELLETWNKHGKSILSSIGDFFVKTQEHFNKIWTQIIEPIVRPAIQALQDVWDNHLKDTIGNVMDFVANLVQLALNIMNKFVIPIKNMLVDILSPAFQFFGGFVGEIINGIGRTVSTVVDTVVGVFNGLITFLNNAFAGNWEAAWEGLKDTFRNIVSGLGAIIKAPINAIIDVINTVIGGINNVKVPDWIPGIGGKGVNISKLPRLARGGVIDSATVALVGESGREAVMPLERNTGWIDELANKLAQKSNNSNSPVNLVVKIGEDTLIDKVITGINNDSFMRNGLAINI